MKKNIISYIAIVFSMSVILFWSFYVLNDIFCFYNTSSYTVIMPNGDRISSHSFNNRYF